ncbi:hypothetical protein BGX31_004153 [Mortierella sp. GBA43]|nr:hypothetical protein BGX31_004153 [Mortierella sp. GBA43]
MEIISPLDLPEIRHMLIKFLRPREFTHLVLVCKAWYESFAPALWTSVIPPKAFNSKLDRFLDGLNRNRLLVRILEFERDIPPLYRSIHLPSLETLHILFNPPTREEGHIITNFLWRHSTVRHLKLKWLTQNGDPSVRWTLLKGFRNLSTLTIHGAMFEECRDPDAMRDLLLNLNTLHLSRIQLPHYSKPSNGFPKMKNLTLQNMRDTPPMEQLQFILLCSNLKRLGWSGTEPYLSNDPKRTYPIVQFAKALEANTWSELEYLEWFSHRDSNWELQCVIGAIPRLVGFTMDQISEQDLTALSLHFGWIKELNLDRVEIMDNGVLAEALRSCPQLESFRALTRSARE